MVIWPWNEGQPFTKSLPHIPAALYFWGRERQVFVKYFPGSGNYLKILLFHLLMGKLSFSGAEECGDLWSPSILWMQGMRIATALRASQWHTVLFLLASILLQKVSKTTVIANQSADWCGNPFSSLRSNVSAQRVDNVIPVSDNLPSFLRIPLA